jgi:hypothetical protein
MTPDDDVIRLLVAGLARPHRSGGHTIERATLLAAGADFNAVVTWIHAHGGEPEAPAARSARGLHGARHASELTPQRFVLPAGALDRARAGATQARETP